MDNKRKRTELRKTRRAIRKNRIIGNHYSCVTFLRIDGQHGKRKKPDAKYGYNKDENDVCRFFFFFRVEDLESFGGTLLSTPVNPRKLVGSFLLTYTTTIPVLEFGRVNATSTTTCAFVSCRLPSAP